MRYQSTAKLSQVIHIRFQDSRMIYSLSRINYQPPLNHLYVNLSMKPNAKKYQLTKINMQLKIQN